MASKPSSKKRASTRNRQPPRAPTKKARSSSGRSKRKTGLGKVDDDLLFALRHPLRLRMLVSLNEEGDASPADLAKRLGSTTEHCSHHIKVLRKYGYVEFVRKDPVRSGVKSIYRAVRKVEFPQEVWQKLPPAVQNQVITGLFLSSFGDAETALLTGAFEKHPESHASWTHFRLDARNWNRLRKLLERTLTKAIEIGEEAKEQQMDGDIDLTELLEVSFSILSYPLPESGWHTDDDQPTFLRHESS